MIRWKRAGRLALAGVATLALAGAEGGCNPEEGAQHPSAPRAPDVRDRQQPGGGAKQPEPAPADPNPHQHVITVRTGGVEDAFLPYEVEIYAPGATPAQTKEIIIDGRTPFVWRATAPDTAEVRVRVEVKPARAGSTNGYCAIEAGNQHDGPRFIAKGWRVNCWLIVKPKQR